jgi:hypothetical protein
MDATVYPKPPVRRLRVYAFDPHASTKLDTVSFNTAMIELPWEDDVLPGPVNEYLEVIDIDPVSGQFYEPVDLNNSYLLAQDGLPPSEGNPRFHQQMVFAVAMKTIRAFERALGRKVFWSPRWSQAKGTYEEVPKLRIYPHALREPNAYYSRDKKALLFGYFRSSSREVGANWVFTALSHDIAVHETTHAILDGLHRRYAEPTSHDSLAFHEAFADIVALLSHFTLTEAVRSEILREGGRLDGRSLMSGLAKQFGVATGKAGALREAIDAKVDGEPDGRALDARTEPHERGAILVAAVFDAFLTIYQRRVADLLRIANVGATEPRPLHPDLVERLAREASKSADHVLRMCLRALDYLPPFDVRFGEFLRAIITADTDLIPNDRLGYRLAMIEAFRQRGILPENSLSLAPDSLLWEVAPGGLNLKGLGASKLDLYPQYERAKAWKSAEENRKKVHAWILHCDEGNEGAAAWQRACGVVFQLGLIGSDDRLTISDWPASGTFAPQRVPKVEVHSVRVTRRAGPDGQDLRQLIIEITQRRRGFYDVQEQEQQDQKDLAPAPPDFIFRGGATLIFDLREAAGTDFDGTLRYVIRKRISDDTRLRQQADFLRQRRFGGFGITYPSSDLDDYGEHREPFALVHRGG